MQTLIEDTVTEGGNSDLVGLFAVALNCPDLGYKTTATLAAAVPALASQQQQQQKERKEQQREHKQQREEGQQQQQPPQQYAHHQQQQHQLSLQHFTSLLTSAAANGHSHIGMAFLEKLPWQASHLTPTEVHTVLRSLVTHQRTAINGHFAFITSLCRLPGGRQLSVEQVILLLQQAVRRGSAPVVAVLCELPVIREHGLWLGNQTNCEGQEQEEAVHHQNLQAEPQSDERQQEQQQKTGQMWQQQQQHKEKEQQQQQQEAGRQRHPQAELQQHKWHQEGQHKKQQEQQQLKEMEQQQQRRQQQEWEVKQQQQQQQQQDEEVKQQQQQQQQDEEVKQQQQGGSGQQQEHLLLDLLHAAVLKADITILECLHKIPAVQHLANTEHGQKRLLQSAAVQ